MAYSTVFEKSTRLFKFDKIKNRFYATLADLGCNGIDYKSAEFFQPLQKGYGFYLVSNKTGKKIIMRLVSTNKIKSDWHEDDMDVKSWVFKSVNGENILVEIFTE